MIRSCRELERLYGNSKCKCAQYREHFPCGECERQSVSEYSPGPVRDTEDLVRLCLPRQIRGGRIDLSSLGGTDGRGVSVIRCAYVSKEELDLKREAFAGKHGVAADDVRLAKVLCRKVRDIEWAGRQGFNIYDTAGETDLSHADICRSACVAKGTPDRKVAIRRLQTELRDCFEFLLE